jgi:hypothetical protein
MHASTCCCRKRRWTRIWRASARSTAWPAPVSKRDELLPKYQEYVQRYRESGLNFPNRVAVQVMVWLFDTAQFEDALELADF